MQMNIDLETYSSVNIGKSGLYKYAESPDFSILLLAYSINGGPVQVIDMAQGEIIPDTIINLLQSPHCIKHAYNAAFEWYCLSRYFGRLLPLDQWRCTMVHGLYCGYPAGLDAVGRALGLPEDKRKLQAGKALIRYFCCPCSPTKTNGNRTRNLPHHDLDKWRLFVEYNRQDVVTEMEIARQLTAWPVPDTIQRQWETDMRINARGVAVDQDMIAGALTCHAQTVQSLTDEAVAITGLDNPNSISQLARWLEREAGIQTEDLRKETVSDLLKDLPDGDARRMLEIRQELGKTSVKKYNAMQDAVCQDGRVRGLLQFYGANRTGRWAGRLVQVQNLPRTYLPQLDLARELTRRVRTEALRILFGSVPDTLSQLIRTAFIAAPDCTFVDADFSAIEARVIAWLAGEEWVLEVFRTHGRIYEACASQMFGVPIENIVKGRPEYALRQKGKVATLALGYQGWTGALIQMGALRMGLSEDELPEIGQRWRAANPRIVDFWYSVQSAAIETVRTGQQHAIQRLLFTRETDGKLDFLTITLPSGRKLFYAQPMVSQDERGRYNLFYYGVDQAHKWGPVETYGGKLVENITQAVARDCLAEILDRLERAGYDTVFHIHDEVVIEISKDQADLEDVCRIMSTPIDWAPGLPLNADGWIGQYFRKE